MDHDLDIWLDTFAAGAGTAYQWQLTGRKWLRTRYDNLSCCWCPLVAQWMRDTGGVLAQYNAWETGERQGLSAEVISELMRAADHNPNGYDPVLRARLLHICHVEESPDA